MPISADIWVSLPSMLLLFVAAAAGGAINAVAGGGSFFSFPALLTAGIPPINANATSTIALWPGSLASMGAYRAEIKKQNRSFIVFMSVISLCGGGLGALLLLVTPQSTFAALIPYLILVATVLFAFGRPITNWIKARRGPVTQRSPKTLVLLGLFQLAVAIYGGYFGGGIGILMLAALGLIGFENIHEMNAIKALLGMSINGVAVITFIIAGIVAWPEAIVMLIGAVIGAYATATFAQRIDQRWVRYFVILVGTLLTIYFFVKG
jgi:uncharacterized membrane protein YfcA